MKSGNKRSLENKKTKRQANERDQPRGVDGQSAIIGSEHRPKRDCGRKDRQQHKNADCRNCGAPAGITSYAQGENCAGNCADKNLTGDCRSNAELFQMIVAADLSHNGKKWSGRNEDREPVANEHKRCRHAKQPRQKQHGCRHHDSGNRAGERAGQKCFCSAH